MWSSASVNSEPISISSNACPPSVILLTDEKVLAPLNVCVPDKWAVSASKLADGRTPVTSAVKSIAFLVICWPLNVI